MRYKLCKFIVYFSKTHAKIQKNPKKQGLKTKLKFLYTNLNNAILNNYVKCKKGLAEIDQSI